MNARTLVAVALLTAVVACGGKGGGSPTAPAAPTPTITGLSITPATDLIKIKASETFTATATFSNGSSNSVQATWGSDTPSVATIDSSGRATAMSSGKATIFADYQGMHATRLLRVVPDYHGRWQGDYRLIACSDTGDWRLVDFCRDLPIGSLFLLDLRLTQNRDSVSANVDFGELPGPLSGIIQEGGHLVLSGTFSVTFEDLPVPIVVAVSNWETITTDNNGMTGRFTLTFQAAGLDGSARIDCDLRIVTKTSSTPLLATGGEGRGLGRAIARILRKR